MASARRVDRAALTRANDCFCKLIDRRALRAREPVQRDGLKIDVDALAAVSVALHLAACHLAGELPP